MTAFDTAWAAFKEEAAPRLVDEMEAASPVDTGQLAASHSARDGDGGRLEVVSTDDRGPIAMYSIRGTRAHPIDPLGPWPLHWVGPGAEDVFAMHVDHPGTSPNPFNERAWEAARDDVLRMFRDTVGRGVALAYLNPWRGRVI